MLTAMERDQFNEKRSNRPARLHLDDQELLVELIGSADLEVIKDLTRALQLSNRASMTWTKPLAAGADRQELSRDSISNFRRTNQAGIGSGRFLGQA